MSGNIFKKLGIKNNILLSPMAGVTDRAFREICLDYGVAYSISEMVSTKGLMYNNAKTIQLIQHSKIETPFCVQIFGNDLESFKEAAKILSSYKDIDIIDVNMGCPAPKIVNNGAGSALMKNPSFCGKIVETIKMYTSLPVTVKIRAGWDNSSINAVNVARCCESAGADAIAVHGRTRSQMYSGKCNLDIIKDVKSCLQIPVIGNGDITSAASAEYMINHTLCDMISIARGALGNPWIFDKINSFLKYGKSSEDISAEEKIKVIKKHILKLAEYKGEHIGIKEARKHICWYLKNIKDASKYRKTVFCLEKLDDFLNFIDNIGY
ncbi:MAG: tRNA dihydrouridine synthase DusB [Oscillospiraceae bacterium]|jgi:nifR3 family TIM-barrel protein|nr:tRNA dihydrouridine synthase DusB [Oscillospiraceae bacterium]